MISFTSLFAQQRGKASYYSRKSTGSRTSSGERLHHDSLVCAHRSYPFGTKIKVKNLSNGKEVIVKVIDRGPYGRGRVIDLSWSAAKAIGMLAQGITTVEITPINNTIVPYRNNEPELLPIIDFGVSNIPLTSVLEKWRYERLNKNRSNTHHHFEEITSKSKFIENNKKKLEKNKEYKKTVQNKGKKK